MEKGKLDSLIKDSLEQETLDIKMSNALRNNILKSTVKKPDTIYQRFLNLMNKTIEISIPSAAVAGIIILAVAVSGFAAWSGSKKDRSLQGYSDIKVIDIGGCSVIVDDYSTGSDMLETKIKD